MDCAILCIMGACPALRHFTWWCHWACEHRPSRQRCRVTSSDNSRRGRDAAWPHCRDCWRRAV